MMIFIKKLIRFLVITFLSLGVLIFILYFVFKPKPYTQNHPATIGPTVTYFLIDGLIQKNFEHLLAKGKLPTIDSLINSGLYIKNGIGSFPTMTGYAYYPFITGIDASNSGIFGLRWFDKKRSIGNHRNYVGRTNIEMNDDIRDDVKNIFEYSKPYYTASVDTYMNRGVADSRKTGWYHATSKYYNTRLVSFLSGIPYIGNKFFYNHFRHEAYVTDIALEQLERNPKTHWITYPSPDAMVHTDGLTKDYDKLLSSIDSLIGNYIKRALELGQQRHYVIISDHGVEQVSKNSNIPIFLKDNYGLNIVRGKSTHLKESKLDRPVDELSDVNGYFVINGNLAAYLYFNDQKQIAWGGKMTEEQLRKYMATDKELDLIGANLKDPSVELLAYKIDEHSIGIESNTGKLVASINPQQYISYVNLRGDIFGYNAVGINQDSSFSKAKWLKLTADTKFPYAIIRLVDLVLKDGSGDLVITSKKDYDLAADYEIIVGNYKGGHGGIRGSMLTVPYIISGPDIEKETIDIAKSEDVGATILDFMGFENDSLDGKSLLDHSQPEK